MVWKVVIALLDEKIEYILNAMKSDIKRIEKEKDDCPPLNKYYTGQISMLEIYIEFIKDVMEI